MKPNPNIFLWIAASVTDATAVNPNGIKTLLANGLSIIFAKGNLVLSNDPKPDCPVLCNWVSGNFMLVEELLGKALRSFETSVLVNSNLCRKLISSLESSASFEETFSNLKLLQYYFSFQIVIY